MSVNRFDQDKIWTTQDGRAIPLAELKDSHLTNVIRHLNDNVDGWKMLYEEANLLTGIDSDSGDEWYDQLLQEPPLRWLHGTTLYRALLREQKRRDNERI